MKVGSDGNSKITEIHRTHRDSHDSQSSSSSFQSNSAGKNSRTTNIERNNFLFPQYLIPYNLSQDF